VALKCLALIKIKQIQDGSEMLDFFKQLAYNISIISATK
jgi:hypothetical protein